MPDTTEEALSYFASMPLGEFLAHYASQYYDPEKRRQRYLRERELKGRDRSTMTDQQKEIWDVSRDNINAEKRDKVKAEQKTFTDGLESLKAKTSETRERIEQKLREKLERIDADIPIPKNATPERRAYLMEQRAKRTSQVKTIAREDLSKLGKDLIAAISEARTNYQEKKKQLETFYESESQNEYENIRSKVK